MLPDILISAAIAIATIGMAFMGVHVTLDTVESQATKRKYRYGFVLLAVLTVLLIGTQTYRGIIGQQAAQTEIKTALASSEQRIRTTQTQSFQELRDLQMRRTAETNYMLGEMDSLSVVMRLLLNNASSQRFASAIGAAPISQASSPSLLARSTSLRDLDNDQLRVVVVDKVGGIRSLLRSYDSLSLALSQEHSASVDAAFDREWRRVAADQRTAEDFRHQTPPTPLLTQLTEALKRGQRTLTNAQRAELDRLIANEPAKWGALDRRKLNNVDYVAVQLVQVIVQRAHAVYQTDDLAERPLKTINDSYTTKQLANLQSLIDSFQTSHKVDAEIYRDEMLFRLPAAVSNVGINYGSVPVSPSQIVAIADDLERLAKLLPSKSAR